MSFGYQVLGFGAFPSRGPGAYVPTHAAVFDGSADYLIWTPSHVPASNTKKTISFWTKRTKFASVQWILDVASNGDQIQFTAGDALEVSLNATTDSQLTTTPLFRDITAWQHFVVVFDTNNSTAADRVKVYVNGSRIADADLATSTDPAQGEETQGAESEQGFASIAIAGASALYTLCCATLAAAAAHSPPMLGFL